MALVLTDIHKHYPGVRANDGISLDVEAGTLHGLLGENGAGKSTLMKVVSGFISADSGEMMLDGNTLELASPQDAIAAGIGMLHQDPLVFLPFTVLDNFLLGSPGPVRLNRKDGEAELVRVSDNLGFSFDPEELARNLTVGERQQLEITRLIWLGARVLIFDEPTTGISASQRIQLFDTLRALSEEGLIVIFVSHKLEEVEELCDSVTVLRQGKVVGATEMSVPPEQLVEMMFGKIFVESDRPEVALGDPILDLIDCTISAGSTHIEALDLSVSAGEVIGLAGLEGSGQRPFLRALAGLDDPVDGQIAVGASQHGGKGISRTSRCRRPLHPRRSSRRGAGPGADHRRAHRPHRAIGLAHRLGAGRRGLRRKDRGVLRQRNPAIDGGSRCQAATSSGCCCR